MLEVGVLDHGYAALVRAWGSEEEIIEAARMSTDKGFRGWGPFHESYCVVNKEIFREEAKKIGVMCTCKPTPGDEKLLKFLWDNKHLTPFEQVGMTVEIQAPIFVFREWHRHRTQSYNELSARYTQLPDLMYIPSLERLMSSKQNVANKQGSAEGFTLEEARDRQDEIIVAMLRARNSYSELLALGVSREVARVVIPVAQYSRMRASANLRNWLQFLDLRMAPNAQWEIRQYANVVAEFVKRSFPRTYELFKGE